MQLDNDPGGQLMGNIHMFAAHSNALMPQFPVTLAIEPFNGKAPNNQEGLFCSALLFHLGKHAY